MTGNNQPLDSNNAFRDAVESYYLETAEGLFFAVKGLEHPADRLIAVLRYAPDAQKGTRRKGEILYRRLYGFAEQEQFIRTNCPQYLIHDPIYQTTLQSVPQSSIRRVYNPRLRVQELAEASFRRKIEEDAIDFVRLLQQAARVPLSAFGITGSLLIGVHTDISDLDLVVFGTQNCKRVHHILLDLLNNGICPGLRRLDRRGYEELYAQRVVDTQMGFEEFVSLEKRKANHGSFRRRPYFVRFVKEDHEAREIYGHHLYTPLGRLKIKALIAEDQESIYTPCKYQVAGVRSSEGHSLSDLNEIVSFRGRFCEQAQTGEHVVASGTLERVRDNTGIVRHRLLLGNCREDTMLVLQ
jgi:predicted nucleotidyltransferase